jgi:hypothetical protein
MGIIDIEWPTHFATALKRGGLIVDALAHKSIYETLLLLLPLL